MHCPLSSKPFNDLNEPASSVEGVLAWSLSLTPEEQAVIKTEATALNEVEEEYHNLILSDMVKGEHKTVWSKEKHRMELQPSNMDLLLNQLASAMRNPKEHKAEVDTRIKEKCREFIIEKAKYQCLAPTSAEKEELMMLHPNEHLECSERARRGSVINNWFSNTRRRAGFFGIEQRVGVVPGERSDELYRCLVRVCAQLTSEQQAGQEEITQSVLAKQCTKMSLVKLEECIQTVGGPKGNMYRGYGSDGKRDNWVTDKELHGIIPTGLECIQKYLFAVRRAVWDENNTVRPPLEDAFLTALAYGRGTNDQKFPVSTAIEERSTISHAIKSFNQHFEGTCYDCGSRVDSLSES